MSVTVKVILEKKDDVLILPTTALQTLRWTTIVSVMKWDTTIPTPVVVWISDGINSEILSGVSLWEVVSLTAYTATSTSTSTSTNSSPQDSTKSSMQSMRALEWGSIGWPWGWTPPN
jgi:hypothetical protein